MANAIQSGIPRNHEGFPSLVLIRKTMPPHNEMNAGMEKSLT
jgi:hypothetical protein